MKRRIIFITKDALRCDALPVYGNRYWKTPNIDELAQKGTVFKRHYTAGASTAMAFTAMATGKYCFDTGRKLYNGLEISENGNTIFDELYDAGYDVHIAWDRSYTTFANKHFKCEGNHTTIHSLDSIIPQHSPHQKGVFDDLKFKDKETEHSKQIVTNLLRELSETKNHIFLWLHLPHVFAGRNSYDSDIDVFDDIVGIARKYFDDEEIYISADHGQMNGHKGKFSYGFDLEEGTMRIPLITPKFNNIDTVEFPTSNIQLREIFKMKEFARREFIVSETAYYVQPKRKMAIIHDNYKLIYDKEIRRFALYDLRWDPAEELNLFYPEFYDIDRRAWYSLNQRFYYPYWSEATVEKEKLVQYFNEIWKNGTFVEEMYQKILFKGKLLVSGMMQKQKAKHIVNIGK